MTCEYLEVLKESRKIDIGRTSAAQAIVIQFEVIDGSPAFVNGDFLEAEDDVLALEMAYSIFPTIRLLPDYFGNAVVLSLDAISLEQVNTTWWRATANYKYDLNTGQGGNDGSNPDAETLPYIRINFAIGDGTRTITEALESTAVVKSSQVFEDDLPDLGKAIGVTDDGIEGAEIAGSGLMLEITVFYFPEVVTFTWIRDLAEVIPAVNNAEFLTFEEGEVLVKAASGGGTIGEIVPITYSLEIKRNITEEDDYPFPELTMEGHQLVDYTFARELDNNVERLFIKPRYRRVHTVHKKKDLAILKVPGA